MPITVMILKPQLVPPEGSYQKGPHLRPVTGVKDLAAYRTFGRLLKTVRENAQQTQEEVVESLTPYFREQNVPTLNAEMYGNLERGKRYPTYAELLPLYRALVEGCAIVFTPDERELYVIRAREKLAQKRRRIERVSPEQWKQLAGELATIDGDAAAHLSITPEGEVRSGQTDARQQQDEHKRPLIKKIDTSHILGRDEWAERMLAFLRTQPAKKIAVVQTLTGTGKTTAFKLLERRLGEVNECRVLPRYVFQPSLDKTPEDHLDSFLAQIITMLQMQAPQTETAKTPPLEERIDAFLNAIIATETPDKKTILLVDDLQVILNERGELPPCWRHFITHFIKYEHTAMLYAATREWPIWLGSELMYIDESTLERLPPEVCVKLWRNLGFTDVPEELLRLASLRCDGNAGMIELRAKSLRRPRLVYGWRKSGKVSARDEAKSDNQRLIEQLLEEESVFEARVDTQTREILEQVVGTRLSLRAALILDVLSVSALALPLAFLDDVCPEADLAFDELLRCSLIDRDSMIVAGRANLLSFVREACLHKLIQEGRAENIEAHIVGIYEAWLRSQDFSTDQEKSAVVSELTVLYLKRRQFLEAAQLFIHYGWLCTLFGQIPRLLRVYEDRVQKDDWKAHPESEVGVLLLRYQLAQRAGQKIDAQQHDRSYQTIHDVVFSQNIRLHPSTEVHLAHQLMLIPMRAKQFAHAYGVLEAVFERITQAGSLPAEAHASFLYSKARLLARWGEYEEENGHEEETARLRNECVDVLAESITLWQACQVNALPLQKRYIDFRLARSLNDYAYRQRLCDHLSEAERAMRACLQLKNEGAALPKSLATSLSEYSQILAGLGRIQEAHSYNDQARHVMDTLKGDDHGGFDADRGMVLIERGEIYLLQARIDEAEVHFKEGRDLTRESASRQKFYKIADRRLEWIDQLRQSKLRYQLDVRWFEQYAQLAAYDELDWLIHSGPFTAEEQREWDKLFDRRQEAAVKARLSELMVQSRQREFALCIEEEREPRLHYPKIPIGEVEARIHDFESLKSEIETKEANAVVRQLYLDSIEEHLALLCLCASIHARALEHIQKYNQVLYGLPGVAEMKVALHWLFSMLERARRHSQAASLAEPLLLQLKQWHLHAEDFLDQKDVEEDSVEEKEQGSDSKRKTREKQVFSPAAVQRFFQDVFYSNYHVTNWDIVVEPARENTYIDVDVRLLSLPQRPFSIEKIRQLLAEEIETHAFRSMTGRRSPLALLASGTAGYGSTEEGLAKHYIQQVAITLQGKQKNNSWPGTLAIGLMAGVISPPLTFRRLCTFLEKVFLVRNVLSGSYESLARAEEAAKQEAWKRTSRTVRGITDLTVPGLCSLKDRIYLQGTLNVARYLEEGRDIQQLYVGKIGIDQIEAMKELHILSPSLPHLQLALDPNLHTRLAAFERR